MSEHLVIAGLGNPGREYEKTRHNFGFMVADACAGANAHWREGSSCLWFETRLCDRGIYLLKPQRYMNVSGPVVRSFLDYYKISSENLLVVHDDLDLPPGEMRFRESGGDGGHNGIKSIINSLGSGDFVRLKIGIGRPQLDPEVMSANPGAIERLVTDWVLGRLSDEESVIARETIGRALLALEEFVSRGLKAAQNKYNK